MREKERESGSIGRGGSQASFNGRVKRAVFSGGIGKSGRVEFRERLFSIFVENLNPKVDLVCLWGVFKSFGRVRDVFLSSKINSKKKCFAFVHFESLEEASKVAKMVNGMHVYGWPIRLKVATYGWNNRRSFSAGRKAWSNPSVSSSDGNIGTGSNEKGPQKHRPFVEGYYGGFSKQRLFPGSRSFAEIVSDYQIGSRSDMVKSKEEMLTFKWSAQRIDDVWLKRSVVGILKHFSDISSVNNQLSSRGFLFSSAFIGDKNILWSFETERESLLVDEDTRSRFRFDRGRVLILLPNHHTFSSEIKVVMDEESFVVKLEEEGLSPDVLWMKNVLGLHKEGLLNGMDNSDGFQNKNGVGEGSFLISEQDDKMEGGKFKGDSACVIKDKRKSDGLGQSDSACAKLDIEKNRILDYGDVSGDMVVLGSKELIGGFVGIWIGGGTYDKWEASMSNCGSLGSCVGKGGECIVRGGVSKLDFQCNESLGSSVNKIKNKLASLERVESKKSKSKSIRVFGSDDGLSGGVAVSGDHVVYINFQKGKGLLGSSLCPVGGDLGGPAIDLYVDLRGLEPFFRNEKVRAIVASPCPSARRRGKKNYFPSRIHEMKTRSVARGYNFNGLEKELADRIACRKNDDMG
ncbi:hypothetical protein Dsin_007895 [Dipteronia sinensis]|uniref:RRM domain-containing protein n=1 Tax=Dipteronia sinensis TaxID=43782 RepID=A0AAE0B1W7_9ROSI|nr:hypothetical protein Dsin_007895 [Dipteronia sinensis]